MIFDRFGSNGGVVNPPASVKRDARRTLGRRKRKSIDVHVIFLPLLRL